MKKRINIKQPKVFPKERVLVRNYRCKRKDGREVWEEGTVDKIEWSMWNIIGGWSYDIRVERGDSHQSIRLYVGDDGVKRLK